MKYFSKSEMLKIVQKTVKDRNSKEAISTHLQSMPEARVIGLIYSSAHGAFIAVTEDPQMSMFIAASEARSESFKEKVQDELFTDTDRLNYGGKSKIDQEYKIVAGLSKRNPYTVVNQIF